MNILCIHVDFLFCFVVHVGHPSFDSKGIEKYLSWTGDWKSGTAFVDSAPWNTGWKRGTVSHKPEAGRVGRYRVTRGAKAVKVG